MSSSVKLAQGWTTIKDASGRIIGLRPPAPPPGSYDPALDAQQRAGDRGLAQYLADLQTQGQRAQTGHDQSLADLLRSFTRGKEDIGTSRTRANEDYGTATAANVRNYQRLGSAQTQNAVAAGVEGGGALLASQQARDVNQAIDQAPIDTAHTRTLADLLRSETRLGEDYGTGVDRENQGYRYGVEDRAIGGQRATDENTFFGQDTAAQRLFQAAQNGFSTASVAPPDPNPGFHAQLKTPVRSSSGRSPYQPSTARRRPARVR